MPPKILWLGLGPLLSLISLHCRAGGVPLQTVIFLRALGEGAGWPAWRSVDKGQDKDTEAKDFLEGVLWWWEPPREREELSYDKQNSKGLDQNRRAYSFPASPLPSWHA